MNSGWSFCQKLPCPFRAPARIWSLWPQVGEGFGELEAIGPVSGPYYLRLQVPGVGWFKSHLGFTGL